MRTQDHQNLAELPRTRFRWFTLVLILDCLRILIGGLKNKKYRTHSSRYPSLIEKQLSRLNIPLYTDRKRRRKHSSNEAITFSFYFQEEWTEEVSEVVTAVLSQIDQTVTIVQRTIFFRPSDLSFSLTKRSTYLPSKSVRKKATFDPLLHRLKPKTKTLGSSSLFLLTKWVLTNRLKINEALSFPRGSKSAEERLHHYFWASKKLSYYKNT